MAFKRQDEGTADDWRVISQELQEHHKLLPSQVVDMLRSLQNVSVGFATDQLHHSLMTGTLARRSGASDEEILIALLHDIGKTFSSLNHGPIGAEMLKPYISDDAYQVVYHHQHFQGRFYYHYFGGSRDIREQWKDESWYALAEKLVDEWDNPAFDPDYDVDSLESFMPIIEKFFLNPQPPFIYGAVEDNSKE